MEEKKQEFSNTQEDFGVSVRGIPKSILRSNTRIGLPHKKTIRKSQTMEIRSKSVSFSDRHKKPLHVVHEIEPFVYEESQTSHKKYKTSCCVVF